jgi:hypothetical protein
MLSLAELTSLGLGTYEPLVVTQTGPGAVAVGITTADFTLSDGPDHVEKQAEFTGNFGSYSVVWWYGPFPMALRIHLDGSTDWPQASRALRQPR